MKQTVSTYWPFELDTVENYAYYSGGFSKPDCESIIQIGTNIEMQKGLVSEYNNLQSSLRKCFISWIYPNDVSNNLFKQITNIIQDLNSKYFMFDLTGFVEGFQFTKYDAPDGVHEKHTDSSSKFVTRKLTFILQLSDPNDYEGGDLILHYDSKPTVIKKEQGYVTVFPSYTVHEVTPVTKGTRYSLVGWVTGPRFR